MTVDSFWFATVAGAEEHHHGFADDAAKAGHDRGDDAGERRGHYDAQGGLQAGRTHRKGGLFKMAGDVVDGVFRQGKDGGNRHERQQGTCSKGIEAFLQREEGHPCHEFKLGELPDCFSEDDHPILDTRADGTTGQPDFVNSMYIEASISLESMSVSVNPDDPVTAEIGYSISDVSHLFKTPIAA